MSAKLRRAVGEARDRLHGRLSARRAVAGAAAASIPALGFAVVSWAGGPAWAAPVAVAAGAAIGAAWGALSRVSLAEAAVALDRSVGAGDRVATAWEMAMRRETGPMADRIVADGAAALRPAAFPWTFRRRDALAALAAAAFALLGLAAPSTAPGSVRDVRGPRVVGEERERLARSAAEAAAALEGTPEAAEAARRAAALAQGGGTTDPGRMAADFAREAARLRAAIESLRATDPDAARALERLADRLEAGGARLASASSAASSASTDTSAATQAGSGTSRPPALPPTRPPAFSVQPPADPFALARPTWPPEYDGAVERYFSEDGR